MITVPSPTRRRPASRRACLAVGDEGGFTLIEVLVASVLLLIGAFATLALLDNGAQATSVSRQGDVANAVAQEMVERATGGRYTVTKSGTTTTSRNDMTDVDGANSGPADRLRASMGDAASAVSPATPATGFSAPAQQTWSVRRNGTTYTVGYVACTRSDTINGSKLMGPYDCSLIRSGGTAPTPNPPASGCSVATAPINADGSVASSVSTGAVGISLQLLGALGIKTCLDAGALTSALAPTTCSLANAGALGGTLAPLVGQNGLLGGLARVNAGVDNCAAQIEQPLVAVTAGLATSTKVAVTVSWTDTKGRPHQIDRATLVRRAAQ